ncbi:hypothetical protein BU23DRAFT_161616 [Bimuria novae-zelandiae CBS 107.79]|uniref:Uncharacterized protein n=1 Tax=Bimuria novae-zelandiae CBS 107.79 TaxID=1447943 RepID=A0A6A5VBB5_9PLEO|nr:hypothetical protein BU23DRAFT_161616 [Bimuria novae-zelandiae CBS 107.79]
MCSSRLSLIVKLLIMQTLAPYFRRLSPLYSNVLSARVRYPYRNSYCTKMYHDHAMPDRIYNPINTPLYGMENRANTTRQSLTEQFRPADWNIFPQDLEAKVFEEVVEPACAVLSQTIAPPEDDDQHAFQERHANEASIHALSSDDQDFHCNFKQYNTTKTEHIQSLLRRRRRPDLHLDLGSNTLYFGIGTPPAYPLYPIPSANPPPDRYYPTSVEHPPGLDPFPHVTVSLLPIATLTRARKTTSSKSSQGPRWAKIPEVAEMMESQQAVPAPFGLSNNFAYFYESVLGETDDLETNW